MEIPQYEFVTRWRFDAPVEHLYELLSAPHLYPVWMKSLNIKVFPLNKGNETGVGREDSYALRAFLPYTLRWNLKCLQAQKPDGFLSQATGDFEGTGEWTFRDRGLITEVTFQWKVKTRPFLLRYFSGIFKPLFEWNHDWVMKRWERNLREELARKGKIKEASV